MRHCLVRLQAHAITDIYETPAKSRNIIIILHSHLDLHTEPPTKPRVRSMATFMYDIAVNLLKGTVIC